jgi:haloalkane dehalogenase
MPNGPIKLPAKHFLQEDHPQEIAEAVYRFTQRGRYP